MSEASDLAESDDATAVLAGEVGIETGFHKEAAAEGLALEVAATLCAAELIELVGGIGIEAGHVPTWRLQAYVMLELIAEEDGLGLVLGHEHLAAETVALVGRDESVLIAELDDGTNLLVEGDGLFGVFALLVVEVAGLHFHSEASGHGDVKAELQGDDTMGLVVGRGTDVLSHCHSGEEVAGAPLDEEALLGVGVVGAPELIEVRHEAPVDTSSTAGAQLDDEVGMGGTNAFECAAQAEVEVDEEVALLVGGEVAAAEVLHRHVAVPLNII